MYEHTIGVPLILSGPGVPKGQKRDAQVYLRDLFPTTCEMAGLAVPTAVEGKSLRRVITGKQKQVYRYVFGYFRNKQRMIRGDRWKLVSYPEAHRRQLFDLQKDPLEKHDLSQSKSAPHQAKLKELLSELKRWQARVGDKSLTR